MEMSILTASGMQIPDSAQKQIVSDMIKNPTRPVALEAGSQFKTELIKRIIRLHEF
jgi:hypothetical protein